MPHSHTLCIAHLLNRYLRAKVLDAGLEGHLEGLEIAGQLLELTRPGNHQGTHHAQSLGGSKSTAVGSSLTTLKERLNTIKYSCRSNMYELRPGNLSVVFRQWAGVRTAKLYRRHSDLQRQADWREVQQIQMIFPEFGSYIWSHCGAVSGSNLPNYSGSG